jgi:hypothetical protein
MTGRLGDGETSGSRCHDGVTHGGVDWRPGVARRGWVRGPAHHEMNGSQIAPQSRPVAMCGKRRTPARD